MGDRERNNADLLAKAEEAAGAITEDWACDKKHSLNARDHSEGSVYQYLYDPYYLGTHTEIQKQLKEWDYVEP